MEQVFVSERLTTAGASVIAALAPAGGDDPTTRFEAIYNAYLPLLRKIAIRKFEIEEQDVDGLVHDVFATYLANPSNVRDLHSYLIGGICNASRQHRRRYTSERALFCRDSTCAATPNDELIDGVVRNLVVTAGLARLGPSCRDTLQRFYLIGETAPAIARSRNTTANYIRRLLTFCRSRLRAIYSETRVAS